MENIQHFILTRFNVKAGRALAIDKNQVGTQSEDWLAHRFDLFERFCLPSLAAQTNKDFQWLLFFDKGTPAEYRKRIEEAKKTCPQIEVCYIDGDDIPSVVNRKVDDEATILITTRIDNDDAFKDDALAVIRKQISETSKDLCVNFRFGYSYNGELAEVFSQKYNPFSSLIEYRKGGAFVTIFGARHGKIHRLAKVKQITTGPHWLMVVHERNVANRMPNEYKAYRVREWRRLKRYMRKYFIPRIRKLLWPKDFKKKYSIEELSNRFHTKL